MDVSRVRLVESVGPMCVPTLLSLANTAAQLDWLASAVVIPCACAILAPPKMHQPPYITAMYVFDISRIGVHEESTIREFNIRAPRAKGEVFAFRLRRAAM
jgi:hypothetical protein